MSINAINSVSLYEYYYSINQQNSKKKSSPIAKEMQKYGLRPTDDEELNIAMLNRAKNLENTQAQKDVQIPNSERPWADLMYQLNLSFNDNPKDDIQDIKNELKTLLNGVSDEELEQEVFDLENYVQRLYLNFEQNYLNSTNATLTTQLDNLSMISQVNLL